MSFHPSRRGYPISTSISNSISTINQGGGNKLQGLAPTTNKPASALRAINQYAWGPPGWRTHIVCMNQLSGVGRGRSQFGPTADGLTQQCLAEASSGQSLSDYLSEIYDYLIGHSEITDKINKNLLAPFNLPANFEFAFLGDNMEDILSINLDTTDSTLSTKIFTYLTNNTPAHNIYLATDAKHINNRRISINVAPILAAINYVNDNVPGYTIGLINNNLYINNQQGVASLSLRNMDYGNTTLHNYRNYTTRINNFKGPYYMWPGWLIGGIYAGYLDLYYSSSLSGMGKLTSCVPVLGGNNDEASFYTDNTGETYRIMALGGPMGTSTKFVFALYARSPPLTQTSIPKSIRVRDPTNAMRYYTVDTIYDCEYSSSWLALNNTFSDDDVLEIPSHPQQSILHVSFWEVLDTTTIDGYFDLSQNYPYFCYLYDPTHSSDPYENGSWLPFAMTAGADGWPNEFVGYYDFWINNPDNGMHIGHLYPDNATDDGVFGSWYTNNIDISGQRILAIMSGNTTNFIFAIYGRVSSDYIHRVINIHDKDSCKSYSIPTHQLIYGTSWVNLERILTDLPLPTIAERENIPITFWEMRTNYQPDNFFSFEDNKNYFISFSEGVE